MTGFEIVLNAVLFLGVLFILGTLIEGIPGAFERLDDWWTVRQYRRAVKRERAGRP